MGFTNEETEMFLSSVTLVLLTAYQAINFVVAFYRLMRALSHQRSLDASQSEKEMEAHLFRGLGWIVAGTKLGAIETVIGFAQGGFGIAFTRRVLRMLGHACLIIGLVKGLDTVEDFQLYSPGEAQRKRKSVLRAMIQNPRFSTFRHVGGHDFEKQHGAPNPFDDKYASVIRLGDPSWMRRDYVKPGAAPAAGDEDRAATLAARKSRVSRLTFQLASRVSMSRSKGSHRSQRDSGSSFGSTRRRSWAGEDPDAIMESPRDSWEDLGQDVDVPPAELLSAPRTARQRVTVHIRKDRLPVLQLRRFSNLEFLDLIQNPFRDPPLRSLSLPIQAYEGVQPRVPAANTMPVSHISASFTRLPAYTGAPAPAPPLPTASTAQFASPMQFASPRSLRSQRSRESFAGPATGESAFANYDRPWSANAPGIAIGSPSDSAVSFGSPVASTNEPFSDVSRAPSTYYGGDEEPSPEDDEEPHAQELSHAPSAFRAVASPAETISSWVSPGSAAGPGFQRIGVAAAALELRSERGVSTSTTASEVHALALQFPGIPALPGSGPALSRAASSRVPSTSASSYSSKPSRRSMLSREVVPDDASPTDDASPVAPMPAMPDIARRPSAGKRKPAPLRTAGLVDEGVSDVEIEQVVDDGSESRAAATVAARQLPTPQSAGMPLPRRLRGRVADVPVSALNELEEAEAAETASVSERSSSVSSGELGVVRHASLVRREAEEGQQGRLIRVKSVGAVSARSVSASRRIAFSRDSIKVELGHIARQGGMEVESDGSVGAAM